MPSHPAGCLLFGDADRLDKTVGSNKRLHAEFIDYYGQAERVAFAYGFQQGAYYFLPGYAWTELDSRPAGSLTG
jgi:hypothetical protein